MDRLEGRKMSSSSVERAEALASLGLWGRASLDRPRRGHLPYPPLANAATRWRCDQFDFWDRSLRYLQGWRAGLSFWSRDSGGGLIIAARHWPHLLCWQWLLTWQSRRSKREFFRILKLGPGAAGGLLVGVRLFWLGQIVYQRQASDRIASFAYPDAPQVYPRESSGSWPVIPSEASTGNPATDEPNTSPPPSEEKEETR